MSAVDCSIIIPHRGNALGLWATIHSCELDLLDTGITYNFVIVTNGGKGDDDTVNTLTYLERTGALLKHLHFDEPLSPPVARQRGAAVADGRLLCFFDNHCLLGKRYFERVIADFDGKPMDMLHSAFRFYTAEGTHYHYKLKLDYNFWAESMKLPVREFTLYKIAASGHGGFVVRKDAWDEVGGYGPEGLFVGYAGEELATDLKLWRYGKTNWVDPRLIHYHYASNTRGYSRHYTDEYYVNLMVSALVVGGEKWLYRVYESFAGKHKHVRVKSTTNMYDLMELAYKRGIAYSKYVDAHSQYSLDEILVKFRKDSVAMD